MIDKLTLNNEIVLMRKVVRQARVHVISKLIREIKKLRASKGDDALKAKCNRKAERKVEVLMALKKLKPDVVSKFALKNTENATEKIADPNTEIEERALFRLISSKVLAERVNQFRSKYPDWKEFICEMLDEIGANRKKNSAQPVKNINNKTNLGRTQKVEGSANKFNGIKKSSSKSLEKSLKGSNAVKVPEVDMKSKFNAGWAIKDIEPVQKFISIKPEQKSVKRVDETKTQKKILSTHDQSVSHKSSWSVSENKKKKGAAEIRKFSELVSEDDEFPAKEETLGEPEVEARDEVSPKEEAVDPFFTTSDGTTEYRTNIKAADNEDDEDVQTWKKEMKPFSIEWGSRNSLNDQGHPSRGRGYSGRGRDQFGRGRGQFGRGASQPGRGAGQFGRGAGQFGRGGGQFGRGGQFGGERGSNKGRGQGFGDRGKVWNDNTKFKQSPALPPAGDSHLHPSWEAKRKQKEQSISNVVFQGKKIKFDDD